MIGKLVVAVCIWLGYRVCDYANATKNRRLYYASRHSFRSGYGYSAFKRYWNDPMWEVKASHRQRHARKITTQ